MKGEPNDPRRLWDTKRGKMKVAFPRWRELQEQRDSEPACFLPDR